MSKETLRELYEEGRLGRVLTLRQYRSELEELAGERLPRKPGKLGEWWEENKAEIAEELGESPPPPQMMDGDSESEDGEQETESEEEDNE